MKLWKRDAGALKDQNSILAATLSRRTSYRNPDFEGAIIKATSHDDTQVDYRNAQRVFEWICTSPKSLRPLIHALTARMDKTRSWVVAIEGLMLIHGVFCCKTPAVKKIGRLPFDLSNFTDGHSSPSKMVGFNTFVRAYYSFLDHRRELLYERSKKTEEPMVQELVKLQKLQSLLDMLVQIKPMAINMRERLILEAMDCVMIDLFDVYSRICNGIARVLMGIYSAGKLQAFTALQVVKRAKAQGEELSSYFELCRDFGVLNAMEIPKVTQISEDEIRDLERIVSGVSENFNDDGKPMEVRKDDDDDDHAVFKRDESSSRLKAIITEKWEVFEEDTNVVNERSDAQSNLRNPQHYLPLIPVYKQEIPDLISL